MRVFIMPCCSSDVMWSRCRTDWSSCGIAEAAYLLDDLVAGENELANQGHEVVELFNLHADGGFGNLGLWCALGAGFVGFFHGKCGRILNGWSVRSFDHALFRFLGGGGGVAAGSSSPKSPQA
jgi:hypothetical protein